ncbi:MAG: TIGR03086 family metal-binding protein [Acidimicrobiia bacterium]|nr:TIGR03086 family metal-binding protein [Acidimicrobiia bacterium]MDH4307345.1 TIGR03086 family metal-binding protein [Acidimicrobiia bacterium]
MTTTIDHIEAELTEAHRLMALVRDTALRTPCADFTVGELLDHMACWIAVFDRAANERALDFDPEGFHLESGWAEAFAISAEGLVSGLRTRGIDRPMTMTSDPVPGAVIIDMLAMEYIGHGLDLAAALGVDHRFTAEQAELALAASTRLISPEYRGTAPGQFHPIVPVAENATIFDRFAAFLGRDPAWRG